MEPDALRLVLAPVALVLLLAVGSMVAVLARESIPVLAHEGLAILTSNAWRPSEDPSEELYGVAVPVLGSLYTAALALALVALFSLSLTVFVEEVAPRPLRAALEEALNVAASVPTVVYGLWGLSTVVPAVRWLGRALGMEGVSGPSVLSASIVLATMITPYAAAMMLVAYKSVPLAYVEAVTSLGATRVERARIILGMIRGFFAASLLIGFGRAVGETTAVSMVVGNVYNLSPNVFEPSYTVTSLIANQFGMAYYYRYLPSALYFAALLLLAVSSVATYAGLRLASRAGLPARRGGGR